MRLSFFLLFLFVVCLTELTNWLLKAFAVCCAVLMVLFLNDIVLLGCCFGFLFESLLMVVQSIFVFVLWSQVWFSCSFHRFDLYVWISLVM